MSSDPAAPLTAPCAECRHSRADHPAGPCRYFAFPMNCHCRAFAEQPRSQEATPPCPYCQNIDGHSFDCPRPRSQEAASYGDLPPRERPVLFWRGASEANEGLLLAGIVVSPAELTEQPRSQEAALLRALDDAIYDAAVLRTETVRIAASEARAIRAALQGADR